MSPTPKALFKAILKIDDPESDFHGLSAHLSGLPRDVLLFQRRPRSDCGYNLHYRHVLLVCLTNSCIVQVDGHKHRLKTGDRLLLLPFQMHNYEDTAECRSTDGRVGAHILFIGFDLDRLGAISRLGHETRAMARTDWSQIQALHAKWVAATDHGRHPNGHRSDPACGEAVLLLAGLLDRWLATLSTHTDTSIGDNKPARRRLKTIERFATIADSLNGPTPPMAELARQVGVSVSTLQGYLRDDLDTTMARFVRRIRFQHASHLLRDHLMPVSEVAEIMGYETQFSFSRAFKKATGTAPSVYASAGSGSVRDGGLYVQPRLGRSPE
jgi:AraC-like DNA-binding protein